MPHISPSLNSHQPCAARLHKSEPKRYVSQTHMQALSMHMQGRHTRCCVFQDVTHRRRKRLRRHQLLHGGQRHALDGIQHGQRGIDRQSLTHRCSKGCDTQLRADCWRQLRVYQRQCLHVKPVMRVMRVELQ